MFKETILLIFLLLLNLSSFSKLKRFTLKGSCKGVVNCQLALHLYAEDKQEFYFETKTILKNGKFQFSGTISIPFKAYLIINDSLTTRDFYVDYGNQDITLEIDSFSNNVILKNSRVDYEYLSLYKSQIEPFENELNKWYEGYWKLLSTYNQKLSPLIEDSLKEDRNKIHNSIDSVQFIYLKAHPNSYVGFWELYMNVYNYGYKPIYERSMDVLDESIKISPSAITLRKTLKRSKATQLGNVFPFFQCIDTTGKPFLHFDLKLKKYTLVEFWFSSCKSCIDQFQDLSNIYEKYSNSGFEILGISVDKKENELNWKRILNKYKLKWPQYWDVDQLGSNKLAINSFPSNFLLDSSGRILVKDIEPEQLSYFLSKNL